MLIAELKMASATTKALAASSLSAVGRRAPTSFPAFVLGLCPRSRSVLRRSRIIDHSAQRDLPLYRDVDLLPTHILSCRRGLVVEGEKGGGKEEKR